MQGRAGRRRQDRALHDPRQRVRDQQRGPDAAVRALPALSHRRPAGNQRRRPAWRSSRPSSSGTKARSTCTASCCRAPRSRSRCRPRHFHDDGTARRRQAADTAPQPHPILRYTQSNPFRGNRGPPRPLQVRPNLRGIAHRETASRTDPRTLRQWCCPGLPTGPRSRLSAKPARCTRRRSRRSSGRSSNSSARAASMRWRPSCCWASRCRSSGWRSAAARARC